MEPAPETIKIAGVAGWSSREVISSKVVSHSHAVLCGLASRYRTPFCQGFRDAQGRVDSHSRS